MSKRTAHEDGTAVVFRHGNKNVRNVLLALASDYQSVVQIPFVGISFQASKLDPEVLELACASSLTGNHSRLRRRLNAYFMQLQYNWCVQKLRRLKADVLIVWNGSKDERLLLVHAAKTLDISVVFAELSPFQDRLSVDFQGVNFENSLPRDPRFYQLWAQTHDPDMDLLAQIKASLTPREARKGSRVGQKPATAALNSETYIFCPLQVPGDSQLTNFGGWVKEIDHLIRVLSDVSNNLPDGWSIRVKEHPSAKASFADLLQSRSPDRFRVDNETNTFEQVANAQAVLTINSSVGLLAFLYDKPVITLGKAFYAIDGLAYNAPNFDSLADLIGTPEDLTFDPALRHAFLSYLCEVHFPKQSDILAGGFKVADARRRDAQASEIISKIPN